ncbi:MAG: AAA family ATPase, partial [Sarcina sp.]
MSKKLKKIEINNFRVYKNNQVFDFSYNNDEVANLVVLYGPNGFGKTSFCDAVEWGLTGEIERISQNKLLKNAVNYEKGYILKNRNSSSEYGEVAFEGENGSTLLRRTIKLNGKVKKDYSKGTVEVKGELFVAENKEDFLKCILSHDQIDAFLKAVTPEERYEKLISFWNGQKDSALYKQLFDVCKISNKKIDNQIKKIEILEKEIEEFRDINDDLISLNRYINLLNSKKSDIYLNTLEEKFNDDELNDLKNKSILKKTELTQRKNKLEDIKEELKELQLGYKLNRERKEVFKQKKKKMVEVIEK